MNSVYNITAIILAAGEGKRMYSKIPKVLHKVCGKSMVEHVIDCAREVGDQNPVVVVGHGADQVTKALSGVRFVTQEKQLGTGHAVMQAEAHIGDGDILILYGDTPLLETETLMKVYQEYKAKEYSAVVITANFEDPSGYGRIVRNGEGLVEAIVEHKDATPEQKQIQEINSGIYYFNGAYLKEALSKLENNNAQGEYYITDVIEILRKKGHKIGAFCISNPDEIMGVNNKMQLAEADTIMRERILNKHMMAGVTIIDPKNTYIDKSVQIGRDTTILPGCMIEGDTCIGEDCEIGPYTRIKNGRIENGTSVQNSILQDSSVGEKTTIGPFAYIRPGNKIGKGVRIGDFVEMKNSNFGDYSKASHLTYVGDGDVGSHVNLGCGVVFVNYDGKKKARTTVGDNCFIGCNSNLIAPVTLCDNSYIAAGTTVTKEVPEGSLAIGRVKQENKVGWVNKNSKE